MEKDLGAPDIRIHYIRVTNGLDQPFTDRYDGIPVTILPNSSDNLQLDMAEHFFGYDKDRPDDPEMIESMFRHICKRQGWNTIDHLQTQLSGKTLAREKFEKLTIKPVIYRMVEEKPNLDEPIPADPQPLGEDELPALPKRKTG